MTVPASRTELLVAIEQNFVRLMTDLGKVPPTRTRETTLEGHAAGTMMSPSDLIAYLIGWNELVLKWLKRDDQGLPVDFPETGFARNQLEQLAQKFYHDHRHLAWPTLLARLDRAKSDLALRPYYGNVLVRPLTVMGFGLYVPPDGARPDLRFSWTDQLSPGTVLAWARTFTWPDSLHLTLNKRD